MNVCRLLEFRMNEWMMETLKQLCMVVPSTCLLLWKALAQWSDLTVTRRTGIAGRKRRDRVLRPQRFDFVQNEEGEREPLFTGWSKNTSLGYLPCCDLRPLLYFLDVDCRGLQLTRHPRRFTSLFGKGKMSSVFTTPPFMCVHVWWERSRIRALRVEESRLVY